jgi:hypothetical protein
MTTLRIAGGAAVRGVAMGCESFGVCVVVSKSKRMQQSEQMIKAAKSTKCMTSANVG